LDKEAAMQQGQGRTELFDRLAVVGKAFASPKRLELLDLLAQGERTVDALAQEAGMGLTTVSAHLQILKLSNLVRTRRERTRIFYRLAGDDVARLYAAMRDVARVHSADVGTALRAYLGEAGLDDVRQVTREELLGQLEDGSVVLLDVRPPEEYAAGHIPHARSVPFADLAGATADLDDAREVVAYCRGAWCVMAHDAVRLLAERGIAARRLEGGMLEWRSAGYPVQASA
jgi:rhodanese-related sulfurtransferase